MDTVDTLIDSNPSAAHAFVDPLTPQELRQRAPAVFAPSPDERTGSAYRFVSTERVLDALGQAGFLPIAVVQTRTRSRSPLHARHAVRLRRRFETVDLNDSVPEIILLNSHDGTSAYEVRLGLFRAVCTNGLIVSAGAFPVWRVSHRGDHLDRVVTAALELAERFGELGAYVQRMERTFLEEPQRLEFASQALSLRFPQGNYGGLHPQQLLEPRRQEDSAWSLWATYNICQEAILQGGLRRRSPKGRLVRTRPIRAIREDVRVNSALWDMAVSLMA
jgi:Domain of unknown function (DUF932)